MLNLTFAEVVLGLLAAIATVGIVFVLASFAFPGLLSSDAEARVGAMIADRKGGEPKKQSALGRLLDGQQDSRRRQVQESLKQVEERARQQRRTTSIRLLILRSGLSLTPRRFWVVSGGLGLVMLILPLAVGLPWYVALLAGIIGVLGLPRWFLSFLAKRRQKVFLEGLADAVDVMVRGLKSGLPLSDAMRMIASEAPPPIGPEFTQVVEGQRLGIPFEQGLERMYERMPLPELNFLSIVINVQMKTGGNLSEALGNLSKVLRERKKLEGKVRSMSQEAKSSAAIIGSLPFLILGGLSMMNPAYLTPLLTTGTGHIILACSGIWMVCGVIVMRNMINFDI